MRKSTAPNRTQQLGNWTDWGANKTNTEFFAEALSVLEKKFRLGNKGLMTIGLVGSRDLPGVTLRRAQSMLRWDRRPSLWSHTFLIDRAWNGNSPVKNLPILEIPIHSRGSSFPQPERNGVTAGAKLELYADPNLDANVALISVARREMRNDKRHGLTPLENKEVRAVQARARDFNYDRLRYDLWDSLGAWQRYLWSDGGGQNPLRVGVPICASAYVEMAFEAINLDLVPAVSERNSAPEHIWNAAVWWHQAHGISPDDTENPYEMVGCYVIRDKGCSILSTDE